MGKLYCLAGVVLHQGLFRVVRPLLAKNRTAAVRNVGWSPWLLDGHARWEIFELIAPEAAAPEAPHLEDFWVRTLRPQQKLATEDQRHAILAATTAQPGEALFGVPLMSTRTAAYLQAATGQRSLATLVVPSNRLAFSASWRNGATEPDYRITLPVPEHGERTLPVKDHHLLLKAEQSATDLEGRLRALNAAVQQMGEQVAVRIGLSRPFATHGEGGPAVCWLMADGFFSWSHPQA